MPRIEHIHVAPESGAPLRRVDEVEAVAGQGLVGDRKYDTGAAKAITVVSVEELAEAEQALGYPIPPGATRRNVTVSGTRLPRGAGTRILLGDVEVEVVMDCAPCEKMEASVGAGARAELALRAGIRGRVVSGGILRVGDEVKVEE